MAVNTKISVVMATYNRAETLRETIQHLLDQSFAKDAYEIIIADDGSTDDTRSVVEEMASSSAVRIKYLWHENHGPGYTQNRGIREAVGEIIVLMADDIFMQPGALQAHFDMHKANPGAEIAVLGQVSQSPKLNKTVFLRTWDPFKFRDLKNYSELPYYFFWACNISFKRGFMLENGMFREPMGRAGAAAHEDVELGYRLHKQGLKILYCKDALGHHYHIETLAGAMKRAYQRGLNWGEFRSLVPEPEVVVRYHVLSFGTLKAHVEAFRTGRVKHLIGADRYPVLLCLRYLLRALVFNKVLVNRVWIPLLESAEHCAPIAKLVHRQLYRGVISYHFFKGCRDGEKIYAL